MGAAWHAVAAPGVGKPEVLARNTKGDLISLDALGWGMGSRTRSQNSEDKYPRENSLLTSGKGLAGQCYSY